ncbi:MAG: BlaI/MecI/CopY family transcriptional regulator [Acidobacteriaceae bacterium]
MRFFNYQDAGLGPLEREVMEVLWTDGEGCVKDVAQRLARPLAYTTVMTTMDRLFKKGLLRRKKFERAFLYASKLTRAQWESERAGGVFAEFLAASSSELLLSSLVDAVGQHDPLLLEELENKVRAKRAVLSLQQTSADAKGGKR